MPDQYAAVMSWRLGVGLAVVVGATIAAVVIAIMSVGGPGDPARIEAAIHWPAQCPHLAVNQPSRDPILRGVAGTAVQTADIGCEVGPHVAYARFSDRNSLDRVVVSHAPSARYCLIGSGIAVDRLGADDPTIFIDMCRSLGGTFSLS